MALIASGCGGDNNEQAPTATPSETGPTATPTQVVSDETLSLLRDLTPDLLQASDLPDRFEERRNDIVAVSRAEVPGLSAGAAAQFQAFATADASESVQASVVLPENASDVSALLEAFGSRSYISALTGDAPDAQTSEVTVPGAPEGTRAIDYSATVPGPDGAMHLEGRALAFTHGRLYIVLIHAAHGGTRGDIGLGQIASTIDQRLAANPAAGSEEAS